MSSTSPMDHSTKAYYECLSSGMSKAQAVVVYRGVFESAMDADFGALLTAGREERIKAGLEERIEADLGADESPRKRAR
jgi:hypothetical protein